MIKRSATTLVFKFNCYYG